MVPGVEELLASPLACGFFLLATRERLTVAQLCRPATADTLLAEVAIQLNPWTTDAAELRVRALSWAGRLREPAAAALADPASAWWWAPLGPRQVSVGTAGDVLAVPPLDADEWAAYGQRPFPRLVTSTPYEGAAGSTTRWPRGRGTSTPTTRCGRRS